MESILFINPPSPFLLDEKVFPNLAPLFVATEMRRHGYACDVLDLAGKSDFKIGRYDLYALTGTSSQFSYAVEILKRLRKEYPSSRVVIGGPHASVVSSLRRKTGDDPNFKPLEEFDSIIEGEGEVGFKEMFESGWRNGGLVEKLDDHPFPDRSLIDIGSYHYTINGLKATSIITQRGCPFNCYFCCGRENDMYRKVKLNGNLRINSPERVIEEMDHLNERFGFEAFMWYDDEVNIFHGRLKGLLGLLKGRKYQHRGFIKSEIFVKHPEQADILKEMGFFEVCTGVESGSDRILKRYVRKNTTSSINSEARRIAHAKGIRFKAFTIIGHPTETYDDVMATKEWLLKNKPDDFDVTIHQPYPGAPAYDDAQRTDRYGYEWDYQGLFFNKTDYSKKPLFYKGVSGEYQSSVRTDELSAEEIVRLREEVDGEVRDKLKLPKNTRGEEVSYGGAKS